MLELLIHRVKVISDELNAASERVGALAQHLDGLLHELDILLGETASRAHACGRMGCLINRCARLILTLNSFLAGLRLLSTFAQTAHLDFRTGGFLLIRHLFLAIGHETLGFLNEGTAAAHVLILLLAELLLRHIVLADVAHGSLLFEVHLLFTLLSHHLLLLSTRLFIQHSLTLLIFVFGTLTLLFFGLPLFAFLVLGPLTLFLFLILHGSALFLLSGSLGMCRLFGLCLSASLFLSGSLLRTAIVFFLGAFFLTAADYLGDIRGTIDV